MVTVELAYGALIARSADGTSQSVLALLGCGSARNVRRWMRQLGVYDAAVYRQACEYIAAAAQDLIAAGRVWPARYNGERMGD